MFVSFAAAQILSCFLSKLFLLIIRQYDWVGSISACMQKQVNFIKKDKIDRIFANPRKMFFLCRK